MSRSGGRRSRRRKPLRFVSIVGMLICLASVSGIGTVTLAKYINGNQSGWLQIMPEKFYFASNILEEPKKAGTVHQLYDWNPAQPYLFFMDIRNWKDDLRIAPRDIIYSVSVESDKLTGITGEVDGISPVSGGYVITGGTPQTQKLAITIPAGQTDGNASAELVVTVKAKPQSGIGYTRTLKGTFQLNKGAEDCKAQLETHPAYIDLLLGVDRGQTVTVTWPSCLAPDNTNPWMTGAQGNSRELNLRDEESCRLRFFITGEIGTGDSIGVKDGKGSVQTISLKQ